MWHWGEQNCQKIGSERVNTTDQIENTPFPDSELSYPVVTPGGLSRECAPPYPQRDRKRRLNGAVCRNRRIKRLVPCRC